MDELCFVHLLLCNVLQTLQVILDCLICKRIHRCISDANVLSIKIVSRI